MSTKKDSVNRAVTNRGPAAAAENRRAILSAARRLFARRGYDVPLSAIAREAGVSQGVMYRHFPGRLELALEAFEDNFAAMEQIIATGGDDALFHLWDWLLERAVDDVGFIEYMRAAREEVPEYDGPDRLVRHLEVALARARNAGHDLGNLQAQHLAYAWRMAYGLTVTEKERQGRPGWLREILSLEAVRRLFAS